MSDIRILLIGAGGYGDTYIRALLEDKRRDNYVLAAVADPYVKNASGYEKLIAAGVKLYDTPEEFFAVDRADLAVIATPIPLHESQSMCVLENGCDLLLEKPIAATPEAGRRIAEKAKQLGRRLFIGFQWCYDSAMLAFKADIDSGVTGKPLDMRSLVLWPRDFAYYNRGTGWAGKNFNSNGEAIYDSVASNATAHYLENMLWLCGNGYDGASIKDMSVETWRANDIETYDTTTLTGTLENGTRICYVVSHALAPEDLQDPMFVYRFENGVARFGAYGTSGTSLTFEFNDGRVKDYGRSFPSNNIKIWHVLDSISDKAPNVCPAQAALRHADAIAMMRDIQPEAHVFKNIARSEGRVWVPGLGKKLIRCFEEAIMLSETGEEHA